MIDVVQSRDTFDRAIAEDDEAELGSADSWSAYDTWFGGGMISSMVEHDRLDAAGRSIDNVFSDLSVRSSTKDSVLRVDTAVASVREAMARLGVRGAALEQRLADLTARRDALLSRRG
jgi:hypothetical protein